MSASIGIDIRMIRHTGIGTYLRGLLKSFPSTDAAREWDLCLFGNPRAEENFGEDRRYPFRSRIYSIEEQLEYPLRLRRCQLWHAPHYNIPAFKGKTKLVVTIHDLIHWIFRKDFYTPVQAFYAEWMLKQSVKKADHIIAVSCKTRDDLIQHFDADPERISVIYEGVSDQFCELNNKDQIGQVKKKYGLPETFFLYVGSLKPHKNVLWLIHLFQRLRREGKVDAALVLVGKKDKRYPTGYEALSRLKNEEGIIHLSVVENEDLVALYNGALALIHPSLYEGFGLTLLEAMACGTPVVASRAASIPEVVGEAAYLVDTCSERDMTEAIVRLEKISSLREELSHKGRRQVLRFSWNHAANKTAEIYEKVLAKS